MLKPGFHDLTPEDYFADPCDVPSLSSTVANELLEKSPFHAWLIHPKLGGQRRQHSKATKRALDAGSLAHSLLLGRGKGLQVIPYPDYRKKAAQDMRDEAEAAGLVPVLSAMLEEAGNKARAIKERLAEDFGIVLDGESELTAIWDEVTRDGVVVRCRSMLDHLKRSPGVIYDLKTCRSAHPVACARHTLGYGYHTQRATYVSGVQTLLPALTGRLDYVLLFCEFDTGVVTPARADGPMREIGERRWRSAVEQWAKCLSTNLWPQYVDRIVTLETPGWALAKESESTGFEFGAPIDTDEPRTFHESEL